MSSNLNADIVILGGGIAGLWLLNLLRQKGFSVLLIERKEVGSGQTLSSQGMIHGGIKYTLSGALTDASESIAAMPARWQACLNGTGTLDLRGVATLSDDYFLFSDGRLSSRVTAFFGSKAIESRVSPVTGNDAPEVFRNPAFKGLIYKLEDIVLDAGSLVSNLADMAAGAIVSSEPALQVSNGELNGITLEDGTLITANHYILAAGKGNGELCKELGLPVSMQIRPLHQVVVRSRNLPRLFAHAVTLRSADKPRMTITSHANTSGETVWYLGGELAESGVSRSEEEQIIYARQELDKMFPWLPFDDCQISTHRIDRAEAGQREEKRPDTPFVKTLDNITVCWPTKLTLAPMMGDMVLEDLKHLSGSNEKPSAAFGAPAIANPPWETSC